MEKQLLARAVNQQILASAQRFAGAPTDDGYLVGFMCECGCMDFVYLTATQYAELGGAVINGHVAPLFPPAVDRPMCAFDGGPEPEPTLKGKRIRAALAA